MFTEALRLVTPADYIAQRSQVFPTIDSLRWFERQHRDELLKRGAILMPAGKKLVDPQAFDEVVVDVGRRLAQTRGYNRGAPVRCMGDREAERGQA